MYDGHAQSVTDMACCCDGCQRNGETESQNKEKKNQPRGHNALMDKVNPFGQSLRWRSQFTPQPALCFPRLHRIDKIDHELMNVFASGVLFAVDLPLARLKNHVRTILVFCIEEICQVAMGTVKWFNTTKGYGFIKPDAGGPDVFVQISAVQKAGISGLAEGAKVSYELVTGRTGKASAEQLRIGRRPMP